ncbi:MAG: hypothetical protein AABY39_01050 [Nitrospirota bacterium]
MNITLDSLKTNYAVFEAMCPYCGIESSICTASISLFRANKNSRTNYCHNEDYDNCPIFLAKILRKEMR